MSKESNKIVFVGRFLTILFYLFLAPIIIVTLMQFTSDPTSIYTAVFFYGIGWLVMWSKEKKEEK